MNYTERTKLIDGLCGAFLMALFIEMFYGLVDASYTVFCYDISTVTAVVHIIGGIILAISLVILTLAYRKEKPELGKYGIELLVFAISAALIPAAALTFSFPFNKLGMIFPLAFAVYYVMKALVIISKRNLSNAVLFGAIEAVYILMLVYGLIAIKDYIFMFGAAVTVIGFIYAIMKKSKFVLVHSLELMVVTFSLLVINSNSAIIFFGILMVVYYLLKSIFVTSSYSNKPKNNKKRRK